MSDAPRLMTCEVCGERFADGDACQACEARAEAELHGSGGPAPAPAPTAAEDAAWLEDLALVIGTRDAYVVLDQYNRLRRIAARLTAQAEQIQEAENEVRRLRRLIQEFGKTSRGA